MTRKLVIILSVVFIGSLFMAGVAQAIPALQLDILGGDYFGGDEESTLTSDDNFTLYALLTPQDHEPFSTYQDPSRWYAISVSIIPGFGKTEPTADTELGVISFNEAGDPAMAYSVTSDFNWGEVPVEVTAAELPTHSIFPTYYIEHKFQFVIADSTGAYNVQTEDHDPLDVSGTDMYYVAFEVDTSNLVEGYELHFDLYDSENGKFKAPFSHDAGTRVPEPGTLVLLGIGMLGVAAYRRKVK